MGIRLVVEVLDNAPAELTPQERLLLVVLAEEARDEYRTCWPGMDMLTRRTGLGARSVRDVLSRLARRGYEVRVPRGTDKAGRPVFAHHGQRTTYRLPRFQRRQDPAASTEDARRQDPAAFDDPKAAGSRTQRRQDHVPKAAGSCRPLPHIPSESPQAARAGAREAAVIDALREKTGRSIDPDHATKVVAHIGTEMDTKPHLKHRTPNAFAAYVRQDSDPRRFLPTPQPPRFQREEP